MNNFPGNGGHYRTRTESEPIENDNFTQLPKERHWGRWITLIIVLGIALYFFRFPIRNTLAEIGLLKTNALRISSLNTTVYFPRQLHLALGGWVVDQNVLLVNDKACVAAGTQTLDFANCYIVAAGPWFTKKLPGQPDIAMQNLVETKVLVQGKSVTQQTYTAYVGQQTPVNVTRVLIPFIPGADFAVSATYSQEWAEEAQRMVLYVAEHVSLPKNLPGFTN